MAIQVSGTEVISNSRALNNIASVDATTAAAITAGGVGGGHWTSLSEVTLGGSAVSQIDITLPSGYDLHRIDFKLPMPNDGGRGEPRLRLLNSSNAAQTCNWTVFYSYSGGSRTQQENNSIQLVPYVGGATNSYLSGSLTIRDASSTSHETSFDSSAMPFYTDFFAERMIGFTGGSLRDNTVISKVRLEFDSADDWGTGSGFYYRLYGHSYS